MATPTGVITDGDATLDRMAQGNTTTEATPPSVLGAAFRQQNIVASAASSYTTHEWLFPTDTTPLATDDLIERMSKDGVFDKQWQDSFLDVRTVGQYTAKVRQLNRETEDRAVLEQNWYAGLGAQVLAGVFDLPTLLPVARGAQLLTKGVGAASGWNAVRAGAEIGLANAAQAGISEVGLHATQELRTLNESLMAVSGATILGGVLGYGGGRLAHWGDAAERTMLERGVSNVWTNWVNPNASVFSIHGRMLNEAQTALETAIDAAIAKPSGGAIADWNQIGKLSDARNLAEARQNVIEATTPLRGGPIEALRTGISRMAGSFHYGMLDPFDALFRMSPNSVTRTTAEQLIDVPLLLNKHVDGVASPTSAVSAVEVLRSGWGVLRNEMYGGGAISATKATAGLGNSHYAKWRQSGAVGGRDDFESAVFKALINGDVDLGGNDVVTNTAKRVRALVLDPIKDRAEQLGLLDGLKSGGEVLGALSYAPRRYRVDVVAGPDGRGTAFKALSYQHTFAQLQKQLNDEAARTGIPVSPQALAGARTRATNLSNRFFDSITGSRFENMANNATHAASNDALEARVVPIPDNELVAHGFIETSLSGILSGHVDTLTRKIAIAERFGDLQMTKAFDAIQDEYTALAKNVTSPQQKIAVQKAYDRDKYLLTNLRDQFLGTHGSGDGGSFSHMDKLVEGVKTYQASRLMGNMTLASIPELSNIIMRQGPGQIAKQMFDTFRSAFNLEGAVSTLTKDEAARWGAALEWALNTRVTDDMGTLSAMADPHLDGFMRRVRGFSNMFSKSTGNISYTDFLKRAAWRTSQDRVLANVEKGWDALPTFERAEMARQGFDKAMFAEIQAAWNGQAATKVDGFMRHAALSTWTDQKLAERFAINLVKETNATIVTPKIGESPILAASKIVSVLTQFQRFNMAAGLKSISHAEQRLVNNPFSMSTAGISMGVASYIALGALAETLYRHSVDGVVDVGKPKPNEAVQKMTTDEGAFWSRAIDRSGVLGALGSTNGQMEKLGFPGLTRGLQSMFNDVELQKRQLNPNLKRDPSLTKALFGPTVSQLDDAFRFGSHLMDSRAYGRQMLPTDSKFIRDAMPFQNHFLFRTIHDAAKVQFINPLLGVPNK